MEQKFLEAAKTGDVEFLKYKLSHTSDAADRLRTSVDENGNNIFHIAIRNGREEFVCEAMKWVSDLLSKQNKEGRNPLHVAAEKGHIDIMKIIGFSNNAPVPSPALAVAPGPVPTAQAGIGHSVAINIPQPPSTWTEKDLYGMNPFHSAMKNGRKEVALYMFNHFKSMRDACDNDGYSPVYYAIRHGWEDFAVEMLESIIELSKQSSFRNPLSVVPYCSESMFKKLLEEYKQLAERCNEHNENFLHEWLSDRKCHRKLNALNWLLQLEDTVWSKESQILAICHVNKNGDNPLHIASKEGEAEAAKLLMRIYEICSQHQNHGQDPHPWLQQNNFRDTPLLTALRGKHEQVALCLLGVDKSLQCTTTSHLKESPLFLAVQNNCLEVAKIILNLPEHDADLHTGPYGQNPMHAASSCPGIEDYLTKNYTDKWARSKDDEGNTPLDNAAKAGDTNLIDRLVVLCSPVDKDDKAWIKACEFGHAEAISKLVSGVFGANGFNELYKQQTDTPLHHINMMNKEGYLEFLSTPGIEILKDRKDKNGATPLHRAIEQNNKDLVEVLLNANVDLTIKGKNHTRAIDLFAIRCKESQEWDAMCKQRGLHLYMSLSYIHSKTNLEQMRNTMAIVAALLATITFAAGIQVPGGFGEKSGYAIHAKKPAFIVFLITDTIAMCFSLLVLFFLIWTLSFSPTESLILMDLSVKMLQGSLVFTLMAFMTGVYAVVSHELLALAITVIVICAAVPFIAFRDILLVLIKLFK